MTTCNILTQQLKNSHIWFALLGVLVSIPGCMVTHVAPAPADPAFSRLANVTDRTYCCLFPAASDASSEPVTTGYQWLFGFIPFGRITTLPYKELLASHVTQQASLLGIGCKEVPPLESCPVITVQIQALSLSGYDLFLTRRPSASVLVRGEMWRDSVRQGKQGEAPSRSCTIERSEHTYSSFAYAPQLQEVLDKALAAAVHELLLCLRV